MAKLFLEFKLTEYDDEHGVWVPYPDDVSDATDHRRPPPSALE